MNFVFWHNIISPHQAPFLCALAELGHNLTVVASEAMSADRLALGWQVPRLRAVRTVIAPNDMEVRRIVHTGDPECIHVLAGARWTALGTIATKLCIRRKRRIGILSEAPDPRGLLGAARRVRYLVERIISGRRFEFLLLMGQMGIDWFQRCGYPVHRLFSFSYASEVFPPASNELVSGFYPESTASVPGSRPPPVEILFVGRLMKLKGVDILLRALAATSAPLARLSVIGFGPEENALRRASAELGITERVRWLGSKPASEVSGYMRSADVLVLPSRKDGWGAVVNEALMCGTPAIVSDAAGSADLIRNPWLGCVFESESVDSLGRSLFKWTQQRRTPEERARIRSWATCLQGHALAEYFVDIMNHLYQGAHRPVPPWCGRSAATHENLV